MVSQVITEMRHMITKLHCVGFIWRVKDDNFPHTALTLQAKVRK